MMNPGSLNVPAAAWLLCILVFAGTSAAATWAVGPQRAVKTPSEAAKLARDGDTVEVDAGVYSRDVAVWAQDNLTLRAVGGRVRLVSDGAVAEDKAIWVVRGGRVSVEGFDFEGAKSTGLNGAGIRFETGSLSVRDCRFIGNEMGILTSNNGKAVLTVENSEFGHNHHPEDHAHNLYVGAIREVTVTGSLFHHALHGHLLKSRAAISRILYNRLSDGPGGGASYELEFPNGGIAIVVGNVVEQGVGTENRDLISFGAEGYRWPTNELYLVHNTLVDASGRQGTFLHAYPGAGTLRIVNNLLVGNARWDLGGATADRQGDVSVTPDVLDPDDYRLRRDVRLGAGAAAAAGTAHGVALAPSSEYAHPRRTRVLDAPATRPGAMQSLASPTR